MPIRPLYLCHMTEVEISMHFPSLEKELVQEIIEVADVKSFPENEVIMRTGQNIRSAFLVLEGLVKVYREDDVGNEFFMYYLDAGKACAISLVCALGKETSGLMAKTVSEAIILSIPLHYVDEWMGKYKSWAQYAVSSYRERFDELLQTIDHISEYGRAPGVLPQSSPGEIKEQCGDNYFYGNRPRTELFA